MPEIKNTFIKSKMNKDLDSRLLPNGEYRDAQNVSVSRSEGSDVGSLENILGNSILTNIKSKIETLEREKLIAFYSELRLQSNAIKLDQLEIIGYFSALSKNIVYLFLTDYRDSSNNRLSNFANPDNVDISGRPSSADQFIYKGAGCYIASYNLNSNETKILVAGNFLNFSKTHPIYNINLLEDLLFWTDNRNQPRKINVEKASLINTQNGSWESWTGDSSTQPYYYNEDDVSVAKFAPYDSFRFIDEDNNSTLISNNEEFLPAHITTRSETAASSGAAGFIDIRGQYDITSTNNKDIVAGDQVIITSNDVKHYYTVTGAPSYSSPMTTIGFTPNYTETVSVGDLVEISRANPDYDANYKGDINLLQDKFSKFSYRFKYDDDEYSLMAPFSQAAFTPRQFGYFINDDETIAAEATDVKFMENRVDQVKLNVTLPYNGNEMYKKLKVKEIQILVKNSDETAVRVVENVDVSKLGTTTNYEYNYLSSKAIQTLPEADLTRVHDKIPVRAMSQEIVGNRVIYGNFLDKHSSPDNLNYELSYVNKPSSGTGSEVSVELPCHTLKQNRTYQVGIVLVDRYGRSSNVILNDADNIVSNKNSTIYAPYVDYENPAFPTFFGKTLELAVRSEIPSSDTKPNYPGLYSSTNPLGYYTYRIVVKQQEQDYYNVYTPGALAGEVLWDVTSGSGNEGASRADQLPTYISTDRISMISLFGDNINKVPRELKTSSNANDETFGSETKLFNRINPIYDATDGSYNKQSDVSKQGESVVSIEPFKNLGAWTTTKGALYPNGNLDSQAQPQPWYPYFKPDTNRFSFHDIFFNASANPFIATIETDFKIGATPVQLAADQSEIERAWQDLGVFETSATKSALDIYWESSTSGLITDYNSEAQDATPAGLIDAIGNKTVDGESIQYIQVEDLPIGSNATTNMQLTDSSGSIITTPFTVTIPNPGGVIDGRGADRSSEFDILQPLNNNFKIITNAEFAFLGDANRKENYTFNLQFESDSTNPDWTGIFNFKIQNCQLQNANPIFDLEPGIDPSDNSAFTYVADLNSNRQQSDLFYIVKTEPVVGYTVKQIRVFNGSINDSLKKEDINYTVIDAHSSNPNGGASDFRINPDPNNGDNEIFKTINNFWTKYTPSSIPTVYNYALKIRATDSLGNGLFTDSREFIVTVILR